MSDIPLIFTGSVLQAHARGIKTCTRRDMRIQPPNEPKHHSVLAPVPGADRSFKWMVEENGKQRSYFDASCPYGKVGDRLLIRETFLAYGHWVRRFSDKKGRMEWHFHDQTLATGRTYQFSKPPNWSPIKRIDNHLDWWIRPSIFMPRAACRFTAEITEVGVERLQEISDRDAVAEGLIQLPASGRYVITEGEQYFGMADRDPRVVYAELWDRIMGAGAWEMNPWVWKLRYRPDALKAF
jgi:hypothetical protein